MKLTAANPWAPCLAGVVTLATLIVIHAPAPAPYSAPAAASYAAPPPILSAKDFHQVALQGFGDPENSFAWSMGWYKNKLYVGTSRAELCAQTAVQNQQDPAIPYPPSDPYLAIPCNPDPQALPLAGEIWALNPAGTGPYTQTNWSRVYQSPYTVTVHITQTSALTMAPRDMAFRGMSVFTDPTGEQALYVSGVGTRPLNGNGVPGPSLLRTTDGISFTAVPEDPGTLLNYLFTQLPQLCCFRDQMNNNNEFYIAVTAYSGAGSIFASATPRQGNNSFQQVSVLGQVVTSMAFFNGHLYLGGSIPNGGYTVWRTKGSCVVPACHPTYQQVIPAGGGLGASGNIDALTMHVFTDTAGIPHLYVGTDAGENTGPASEIIRINTDDSWNLIMGNPRVVNGTTITPTSGLPSGFGWSLNRHIWSMEVYNGVLYAGTFDTSTLWKDSNPAFNTPLMGFDLWASADGLTFTPVTVNGFGDIFSFGARTLRATPDGLFLGSANWDKGLRVWQGQLPSGAAVPAPVNLHVVPTARPGAVALSWAAPPNATVFHVYRATSTRVTLGPRGALAPGGRGFVPVLPRSDWEPGAFTEIGTTPVPSFVDRGGPSVGHDLYYVVAQDAAGNLSQPSNAVASGLLAASSDSTALAR